MALKPGTPVRFKHARGAAPTHVTCGKQHGAWIGIAPFVAGREKATSPECFAEVAQLVEVKPCRKPKSKRK